MVFTVNICTILYLRQGKQNWKASIGVDINYWVFFVIVWDIPDHTRTRLAVEKTSTKCQEHSTFPSSHASLCSHWNDGYPLYPGRTRTQLWGRTLTLNLNLWSDSPKIKWVSLICWCQSVCLQNTNNWYKRRKSSSITSVYMIVEALLALNMQSKYSTPWHYTSQVLAKWLRTITWLITLLFYAFPF